MANPSRQPDPMKADAPSFETVMAHDESHADAELGFECANPWLQIESWAQDASGRPGLFT